MKGLFFKDSVTRSVAAVVLSALVAVFAGCGGGGDGGGSPSSSPQPGSGGSSPSYDLNQMITSLLATGKSLSGSAISGVDSYQLFLNITPVNDASFEGATRKRASQSLTIRKNGATVVATTFDSYYSVNPYRLLGATYAGGGYLVASTQQPALPTSALVGASGSLGTQTLYQDSTKSRVLANQQATWSLEAVTATTADYCVNTVLTDPSNVVLSTTVGCYRINAAGSILGIKWTIAVDGNTLTFQ